MADANGWLKVTTGKEQCQHNLLRLLNNSPCSHCLKNLL